MSHFVEAHLGIFFFSIAAGAWFAYFRLKEKEGRAPFGYHVVALVGGVVAVAAAFAGFQRIDAWGFTLEWGTLQGSLSEAMLGALAIGLVEEGSKLLPLLLLTFFGRRFRRASECLFLAACVGVGFATAENTSLWLQGELDYPHFVARALAAPLTHAVFAAPWGLGLGMTAMTKNAWPLLRGFALSVVAHGAYDLLLARAGIPPAASASIVLALWMWVLFQSRTRAQEPRESLLSKSSWHAISAINKPY